MSHESVTHPTGTYRFLPAIAAYSSGVAAEPGFEFTALRFRDTPSLADGFVRIDLEIANLGLSAQALVGLELRSPGVFDFVSFAAFNDEYRKLLDARGLMVDGVNPISRTNVIPLHAGPLAPSILTAYLVRPSEAAGVRDFVIAGSGEVRGPLLPENIAARGDVSPSGLALKAEVVIEELADRLASLQAELAGATTVNVYTAHGIDHLGAKLLFEFPAIAQNGYVRWQATPPVDEIEFEMDCSRVSSLTSL